MTFGLKQLMCHTKLVSLSMLSLLLFSSSSFADEVTTSES